MTFPDTTTAAVAAARQHALGDLPRRSAARYPDKTAIVCGETRWTFREFDTVCNRIANSLAARGIASGERVALLSRNSHAFAAMRFALARLGVVLVPINFMLKADEIAYILRHAGARLLCAGPDLLELGRSAAALDTQVEQFIWLPGEDPAAPPEGILTFDDLLRGDATPPDVAVDARSPAQIIYTSGTESLPKGAVLTHEAVMWQHVDCMVDGEISRHDAVLHALPLFHCAQLDVFFGPAVYVGATSIITSKPAPENVLALLAAHKATIFFAPPSVWIGLLRSPDFDATDLSVLAKGYYGAAIMPVEVLKELGRRLPKVRLWNFYGQTEIAPLATVLYPDQQIPHAGSAGRAALNVETRVVDDLMQNVPVGEVGEIVHRSPQLLLGYYNDPERTAAAFEGGWFHSGDLGIVDAEGFVTVVDRKKDMIKTGGENVASREVEETIYQLDQVSEVAVIGLPHPYWIEAVTAVVVLKQGKTLTETEVIEFCRSRAANFKAPRRVLFVDQLPKNPSGKLVKRDLRLRYQDLMKEAEGKS
jgi:fatty-acyl-CoA synthase